MYFNFRENYGQWSVLIKARQDSRLFSKLNWPKDAELVCIDFDLVILFKLLVLYFASYYILD